MASSGLATPHRTCYSRSKPNNEVQRMGIVMLLKRRCVGSALLGLVMLALAAPASRRTTPTKARFSCNRSPIAAAPATSTEGTYNIMIYGRDDGPMRIDGYIVSDKLVNARISRQQHQPIGDPLSGRHCTATALRCGCARPASRPVRGRPAGTDHRWRSPRCAPLRMRRSEFALVGGQSGSAIRPGGESVSDRFTRAVQAFGQAGKGAIKEALPAFNAALAAAKNNYGSSHPQLVAYLWLAGMLHQSEGTYPDMLTQFRDALAMCDKFWGADSACSGLMLVNSEHRAAACGKHGRGGSDCASRTLHLR
jgi:hypothetical protein